MPTCQGQVSTSNSYQKQWFSVLLKNCIYIPSFDVDFHFISEVSVLKTTYDVISNKFGPIIIYKKRITKCDRRDFKVRQVDGLQSATVVGYKLRQVWDYKV